MQQVILARGGARACARLQRPTSKSWGGRQAVSSPYRFEPLGKQPGRLEWQLQHLCAGLWSCQNRAAVTVGRRWSSRCSLRPTDLAQRIATARLPAIAGGAEGVDHVMRQLQ